MAYEGGSQEVRLEGADRDRAQTHLDGALTELGELSRFIASMLQREGDPGSFTRVVLEASQEADSIDVSLSTFCSGTTCLYVYDALKGICRPCTPNDHACDPVSTGPAPPTMTLPE